jgi:hypothetical protein
MCWNKKKPVKKIQLIKEIELTKDGYKTCYYTKCNDRFVPNSLSTILTEADMFYDRFLKLKGVKYVKETLKEDIIR